MSTTEQLPIAGTIEGAHSQAREEGAHSRRDLAREVQNTGAGFNGLVAEADAMGLGTYDLFKLGRTYRDLVNDSGGETEIKAPAFEGWMNQEAERIVTERERAMGPMSPEDRDLALKRAQAFIIGVAKVGQLTEQNYPFREQLQAHQDAKTKLASLPVKERPDELAFRKPGEGLITSWQKLKGLQAEVDSLGSQYDGLVGLFGEVLTPEQINRQAESYRRNVLGASESERDTRRNTWVNARARELVRQVALEEGRPAEVKDPKAISEATEHIINLIDQGVFDTEERASTFVEHVGQFRAVEQELQQYRIEHESRNDATARMGRRIASLAGVVGRRLRSEWTDLKNFEFSKLSRREKLVVIMGAVVVIASLGGIANDVLGQPLGGGEPAVLAQSGGEGLSDSHLVGDPKLEAAEHDLMSAVQTAPEPEIQHYDPVEAGHYGRKGELGSLGEFAKDILSQHGIDKSDANYAQAFDKVLDDLIANNETYGKEHGINAGQMINVDSAHGVAAGFETPAEPQTPDQTGRGSEEVPPRPGLENPNLPSDWPAEEANKLPVETLNAFNIDAGQSGESMVQQLGFSESDWNRVAPDLYAEHPDVIYRETVTNPDGSIYYDYRLRKKGYPSWSFVNDLINLLTSKK